jgi:diguanylate cyclase (GGDEF)-like protein/PAS domain S-box-containing protein
MKTLRSSPQSIDILIIEDNPGDVGLIRAHLAGNTTFEFTIEHVSSLAEGSQRYRKKAWGLLLVDLHLTDADADETLERIAPWTAAVPVIVMTGQSRPDVERAALQKGVADFMPKEWLSSDMLGRTVTRAVERHRAGRLLELTHRGFDAAEEGVVFCDADEEGYPIVYCNESFLEISGYQRSEVLGHPYDLLRCEDTDEESLARFEEALETRTPLALEIVGARKNGERLWNEISLAPVESSNGRVTHFVGFLRDITDRVETEQELRRYEIAVENAADPIIIIDREGRYQLVNQKTAELFEMRHEEIVGKSVHDIFNTEESEYLEQRHQLVMEREEKIVEEEQLEFHGEPHTYLTTQLPFYDEGDEPAGTITIARDITELQRLEQQALYDHQTDLPSGSLFRDRLRQALNRVGQSGGTLAVATIDIDSFEVVNQSLGRECGDQLLKLAGQRIRELLDADDTVARLGGDEFNLLLENADTRSELQRLAQAIERAFAAPFDIDDTPAHVSVTIGFALRPPTVEIKQPIQTQIDNLLQTAGQAVRQAKQTPGTSWHILSPDAEQTYRSDIRIENEIRRGLEEGEFIPYFQPIYRLGGGIWAVELLARWKRANGDLVSPGVFIPVAERAGLLQRITEQLLDTTCRQLDRAELPEGWELPLPLNINLSPTQLARENLTDRLQQVLEDYPPDLLDLRLEITEGELLERPERVDQLRREGYRIIIDDFGTGYSSLSRIKELPMDELKLDMEFVQGAVDNRGDEAIVRTVIELGRQLDVPVVAEGVETEAQLNLLEQLNCTAVQGYYFGKPGSLEELV